MLIFHLKNNNFVLFFFLSVHACLPFGLLVNLRINCTLTADKIIDSSPEIPKTVSSIIEMFERSSSVESDSQQIKDTRTSTEESKSERILGEETVPKTAVEYPIKSKKTGSVSDSETPKSVQDADRLHEIDTLETDTDINDDVSPRTHVRQIVEDIEAKVEHITQQVVEDTVWQEAAIKDFDTKNLEIEIIEKSTEEADASQKFETETDNQKVENEESFSVKELVKRHESIVKDHSIDESKDKGDKLHEKCLKEITHKEEMLVIDEPEVLIVHQTTDLVSQNKIQKDHVETDMQKSESVKTFSHECLKYETTTDWENVEAVEYEEPCKLPSPIEQQYSEYKTETAKMVEQDAIAYQKNKEIDILMDEPAEKVTNESQYFMDITENVEPELIDEHAEIQEIDAILTHKEVRIKKQPEYQTDIETVTIDSKSKDTEYVNTNIEYMKEPVADRESEKCNSIHDSKGTELDHDLKSTEYDTKFHEKEKTIEHIKSESVDETSSDVKSRLPNEIQFETVVEPEIELVSEIIPVSELEAQGESIVIASSSEKSTVSDCEVKLIEKELSPEHLASEELQNESLQTMECQKKVKAEEYLITEELDIAQFEEEIVSETAEEEICSAEQSVLKEQLEKVNVISEEILTAKPVDSLALVEPFKQLSDDLEKEDVENDYLSEDVSDKSDAETGKVRELPPAVSETVTVSVEKIDKKSLEFDKVVHEDVPYLTEALEKSEVSEFVAGIECDHRDTQERKLVESPVSDEDLVEKPSRVSVSRTSSEEVSFVPSAPDTSLEQTEIQDDQFQEVFEEKSELEKEHDSYFIEENKQIKNIRKERILLSRQESNIEITVAEYDEPFENEYDIAFQDDQYLDHSDSENEYYERDEEDDEDYVSEIMVETESQTEHSILRSLQALENKENGEKENGEIVTEDSTQTESTQADIYDIKPALSSVTEQAEIDMSNIDDIDGTKYFQTHLQQIDEVPVEMKSEYHEGSDEEQPMAETGLHGRVYSDILEVASEEMEGEPLGFSVRIDEEEEYEDETGKGKKTLFRIESTDECPDDTMTSMQIEQTEHIDTEDTAKVLEIIEGDDEEVDQIDQTGVEQPVSACPSERVEFEYDDIKATSSDYDLALNYIERGEQTLPNEDSSEVIIHKHDSDIELNIAERENQIDESGEEIFQMDDLIDEQDSESIMQKAEQKVKVPSHIKVENKEESSSQSDFKEPFVERTEQFIQQSYEGIQMKASDLGKVALGSYEMFPSKTMKNFQFPQQSSNQKSDFPNSGFVSKDFQDEIEDIESDSIEDTEIDILLEQRSQKILEPEQESMKSSERPLSPTDYTLDVDMDESVIIERKSDGAIPETDSHIYTDVSQQIFIEQSIEGSKSSPPKGKRQAGDGEEFNEDVPPSPSEYTLVASYDQEKMKKALQQSPERMHHTPEKKAPQFSHIIYEDTMSVSMDESVLQRSLGLTSERNVMSASYDEEALKRVYDEEDIMVSSAEHAMQDSLIASSLEPDEYRQTGSVCSGRDEDFSEVSDQGAMEKSYEGDIMTDSYERDSLHRSGGSEHEISVADSVEQDTVELAIEMNRLREQDLMASSMDQEALQHSLGLLTDEMTTSMDQESLRQSLGLDQERDVMRDSLEQGISPKSEDAMGSSDELKRSLGLVDQDLMSGIMDIDSLHRSLGLASSDSQESDVMQKSLGLDKVQSEIMYDSVEEEALKASLREKEHKTEVDIMSRSMDQESLELSLGLDRQEDVMMVSMDQDVLRASLGLDTIEENKTYEEEEKIYDDGMTGSIEVTGTVGEHVADDFLHAKGIHS